MTKIDSLQIIIDSLENVIKTTTLENHSDNTNRVNVWRTVLSSGIIILLFIVERIITYWASKKSRKREFIHNVILKTCIHDVRDFFKEFYGGLKSSIDYIKQYSGTVDQIQLEKNFKLNELKELKVQFDHEFISLIRSVNKSQAIKLTDVLNRIEDKATISLTDDNLLSIDMNKLENEINELKAEFFLEIYKI